MSKNVKLIFLFVALIVQIIVIAPSIILSDVSISTISQYLNNVPFTYQNNDQIEFKIIPQNERLGIIALNFNKPVSSPSKYFSLKIRDSEGIEISSATAIPQQNPNVLIFGITQIDKSAGKELVMQVQPIRQEEKKLSVVLKSQITRKEFSTASGFSRLMLNKVTTAYMTGRIWEILLKSILSLVLLVILFLIAQKITLRFPNFSSLRSFPRKLYLLLPFLLITLDVLVKNNISILHDIALISLVVIVYVINQKNAQMFFYKSALILFLIAVFLMLCGYGDQIKLVYWVFICLLFGLLFEIGSRIKFPEIPKELKRPFIVFPSVLFVLVFLTYRDIWFVYFQADEWFWFKKIILYDRGGVLQHLQVVSHHFLPLFSLQFSAMHSLWGFDQYFYGVYNFVLHFLNVILVFSFVYLYSRKSLLAFISAAVFATLHTPNQAVIWYGTSPMSLPATFFGLLGLCTSALYIKQERFKFVILTVLFIFLGLMFYESLMSLFIFIPVWILIEKKKLFAKSFLFLSGFATIYLLIRSRVQIAHDLITRPTSERWVEYGMSIAQNIIKFPLLGFSQLFVPSLSIYTYALDKLNNDPETIIYLTSKGIVVTDLILLMNAISITLTIIIALSLIFVLKLKFITEENKRFFGLMLIFCFVTFMPYTLLPNNAGLESRHYYFTSIGAAIIIGIIVYSLLKATRLNLIKAIIFFFFASFVYLHVSSTRVIIRDSVKLSTTRINIVSQVTSLYPNLPDKVIFFSEGDLLPFQSGFGEMLMVLYSHKKPYHVYFDSEFLTHMGSEGYEERGDVGFGYFFTKEKFLAAYRRYGLNPEEVYSFNFHADQNKIGNTTEKTRQELSEIH